MARGFIYAAGASDDVERARNPELSKAEMQELGLGKNVFVREIIASRTDCPLGLMVTLAHDYSTDVRVAVAGNPSALQSVMEYLAKDKHVPVVEALVSNPSLTRDVLESLAFHRKPEVRALVAARLDQGVTAVPHPSDEATPELRDKVFGLRDDAPIYDISPGGAPSDVPTLEDDDEPHHRTAPTRTAPVRGFRAPEAM